jgi:hypothetical protein
LFEYYKIEIRLHFELKEMKKMQVELDKSKQKLVSKFLFNKKIIFFFLKLVFFEKISEKHRNFDQFCGEERQKENKS